MFDAFIKVIPNFYSREAKVEFTIVCFDSMEVKNAAESQQVFC